MLSRTAENLFWLARYIERAAFLARAINSTMCVAALPNAYIADANEWDTLVAQRRRQRRLFEIHREADEQNVLEYLLFSSANPSSIRNCIEKAQLNARSARAAVTGEMWETVNGTWSRASGDVGQRREEPGRSKQLSAEGTGDRAALRGRGPSHDAAQRCLLVLMPRAPARAR